MTLPGGWDTALEGLIVPGRPHCQVFQVAAPAAGADWVFSGTTGEVWLIESVDATLVTSSTVATRTAALIADDGVNVYYRGAPGGTQTASLTFTYDAWTASGAGVTATTFQVWGFWNDPLVLLPGHRLRSSTTNIQTGDQWSAINLFATRVPLEPASLLRADLIAAAIRTGLAELEPSG